MHSNDEHSTVRMHGMLSTLYCLQYVVDMKSQGRRTTVSYIALTANAIGFTAHDGFIAVQQALHSTQ